MYIDFYKVQMLIYHWFSYRTYDPSCSDCLHSGDEGGDNIKMQIQFRGHNSLVQARKGTTPIKKMWYVKCK